MAEEGYEFSDPPSLEDFEAQLERSIGSLSEGGVDVLFDRCPVDFLAYLSVQEDAEASDVAEWLPRVRAAMQTLDLAVFVPIEARDRIAVSPSEDDGEARARVDEKLREILFDDSFEIEMEVLEVEGDPARRARAVLRRIGRAK